MIIQVLESRTAWYGSLWPYDSAIALLALGTRTVSRPLSAELILKHTLTGNSVILPTAVVRLQSRSIFGYSTALLPACRNSCKSSPIHLHTLVCTFVTKHLHRSQDKPCAQVRFGLPCRHQVTWSVLENLWSWPGCWQCFSKRLSTNLSPAKVNIATSIEDGAAL